MSGGRRADTQGAFGAVAGTDLLERQAERCINSVTGAEQGFSRFALPGGVLRPPLTAAVAAGHAQNRSSCPKVHRLTETIAHRDEPRGHLRVVAP